MSKISTNLSGVLIYGPGGLRLSALQSKLTPLTPEQFALLNEAKKYATDQGIKHILSKQVVINQPPTQIQQQPVQPPSLQKAVQRHQALVLMCRVYIGSISFEVREETIKTAFSPYGTIKSVSMSWDPITAKHKGFAFVEYELPEAAQLALENMNGIQVGGRQIKVGRPSNMPQAKPVIQQIQEECKKNNRIYVSNVHPDLNEQELAELFTPFGRVRTCRLAMTPNVEPAQHRGCGFIEFDSEAAASEALTMNKFDLGGTTLHVCRATAPAENVTSIGTLDSGGASQSASGAGAQVEEDIQLQLERANKEQEGSGDTSGVLNHESVTNDGQSHQRPAPTNGFSSSDNNNSNGNKSSVIVLRNMVTADEELDDNLQLDVYEECSKHGKVTQVVIYVNKRVKQPQEDPSSEPVYLDEVNIFVKYQDNTSSERAREALNGRFFAGRKVSAEPHDRELFRRQIYSTNTN